MKRYFWNNEQNRLRAFWRITIQMLVWNGLILFFMIPFTLRGGGSIAFETFLFKSPDWVRMVTLLITVLLMARYIDIRHFSEFGLDIRDKKWWQDFGVGLLLGGLTITGMFLIQVALGWYSIQDTLYVPAQGVMVLTIGVSIVATIAAAVYETLWIWSYTLRNASEGLIYLNRLNGRAAVIGALVLCLLYFVLFNVSRTAEVSTVFISNMFRAGLLLALPFILTQRLGLSIGLFIGWLIFQINVYGLQAVGLTGEYPSLLIVIEKGPDLWTGGTTGFGSGLMSMIGLLILSIIITAWNKRRSGKTMFDGSLANYDPTAEAEVRSGQL